MKRRFVFGETAFCPTERAFRFSKSKKNFFESVRRIKSKLNPIITQREGIIGSEYPCSYVRDMVMMRK